MNNYERYKQIAIKIGIPIAIILFLFFIISNSSSSSSSENKNETQKTSLSLFSEEELVETRYMDSVEDKLDGAVHTQDELIESNEKMKKEVEELKSLIKKNQLDRQTQPTSNPSNNLYKSFPMPRTLSPEQSLQNSMPDTKEQPKVYYKVMDQFNSETSPIDSNFGIKKDDSNKDTLKNSTSSLEDEKKIYIPTTAITTGRLLHGLNAPTIMSKPLPNVVMINDVAFLPNSKKLNIKKCNLQVEGYGQLSDERVYFKFTKFVCVNENGLKIYDIEAKGYITSLVDNKIGLPGHVVSKQAEMLSRMFMAGAFEGVGDLFKDSGSSTITSALGTTTTQSTSTSDKVKNIIGNGTSSAAEGGRELYLERAKNLFETIEALSQDVGLVFTDGLLLKPINLDNISKEDENDENS